MSKHYSFKLDKFITAVQKLKSQIDKMVYKLYDLTLEEIVIIEKN